MKNVNLTITTADILGTKETKAISLANIDRPFYYEIVNDKRVITGSLSFAMFMQAVQPKDKESLDKINPAAKFLFSENYSIKIRLTESKSGKAFDLDEFELCPNNTAYKECVCCDTFKHTRLCVYEDVVLPPKRDDEFFVVKILIKHLPKDKGIDNGKWIVQTVYPITFLEK